MNRTFATMMIYLVFISGLSAQEISPYLFGQNHWLADGDEGRVGYIHMLWPQIQASGVRTIRIGGNGYNRNLPAREKLSAMVDSIRHIGAEPFLQVPDDFTAIQATELVEYFTKIGEKRVQYWSIGNEPLLHDEFTIDETYEYIMRIAPAMKRVDPTIKIFVFDECELRESAYADLCGGRLDITGLKENGSWLIDGFSFHKYPMGREFNRDDVLFKGPEIIRSQVNMLVEMMKRANKKHKRTGDAVLMWALTEVNVTYANPNREISGYGNPSFLGGQFIAEIFGIGIEYGAFTVNPWCISETDAVSTDFGYIGMPREFYPRSSYYHMQMMAQNVTGRFLPTFSNQKLVKTIGSISDNRICVMVMNQDQNTDFNFEILLDKNTESSTDLVIRADAALDKRINGSIPNQTTLLFVFNVKGTLIKQITYGMRQNLIYQKPEAKEISEKE
jgi:hypothetical protein